ncbi:helix-turn-helix transcriptional regulator [Streptomyces sp. NRRL F-5123]|uniref:helix-turn-helix transcriptional regulator n=1 Tax=Streptomyces sp. NRRL F-5123 TaxID=1463856 RepID=UPI0004E1425E|nr:helix-turn-helix transcriptional regulator [Streptomyces sp. NRRL F-5123]
MQMDREQLADFLRRSRHRLRPEEADLPVGRHRRTPGLRREEVAHLAGMSADYVMRLEQARGPQPSTQILASLARALRLTTDERDHLYLLAGHPPPLRQSAGLHVRPSLRYLLDHMTQTPAQLVGDLGDLLAMNALAEALFGCVCTVAEGERNIPLRWFTDPAVRAGYPPEEHAPHSREMVADLRAAVARRGNDATAAALVARLREASGEFRELWDAHEVAVKQRSRMRVLHPEVGAIAFDYEVLLTPSQDQRLLVFTPPPGSPGVDALALLGVLGPATAHRSHRGGPAAVPAP